MDNIWERSIPFYRIGLADAAEIINQYDKSIEILELSPVNIGCRNTNYRVKTSQGFCFLRICPIGDPFYRKEKIISDTFSKNIKVPKLLFISENNNIHMTCLIYEYINGKPLNEIFLRNMYIDNSIIRQVAEGAAYIHSTDVKSNGEFDNDYTPF